MSVDIRKPYTVFGDSPDIGGFAEQIVARAESRDRDAATRIDRGGFGRCRIDAHRAPLARTRQLRQSQRGDREAWRIRIGRREVGQQVQQLHLDRPAGADPAVHRSPDRTHLLEEQPQILGRESVVRLELHVADLVVDRHAPAAASCHDILELGVGVEQHPLHGDRERLLVRGAKRTASVSGDPDPPDVVQSFDDALVERDPLVVEARAHRRPSRCRYASRRRSCAARA